MVEAIIALPENMFYNTGIATYIWVLSNRKEERRKGKIQLIDATDLKSPLRKNLGKKNCEFTDEIRRQIMQLFLHFSENRYSKIFNNSDFGYWKITVLRPLLDENRQKQFDKKGSLIPDKDLTDTEQIPLNYAGGIKAFFKKEVQPYASDAWIDESKTLVGYEISFTKHFYNPVPLRPLEDIAADIRAIERETEGLLDEIMGGMKTLLS